MFYNPIEQLVSGTVQRRAALRAEAPISRTTCSIRPSWARTERSSPNPFNGISKSAARAARGFLSVPAHRALWPVSAQSSVPIFRSVQLQYSTPNDPHPALRGRLRWFAGASVAGDSRPELLRPPNVPGLAPDRHAERAKAALTAAPLRKTANSIIPAGTIPTGVTLHLPYGSVPSMTGPNPSDITLVGLRKYSSPFCQPTTGAGCPPDGVPVFSSIFGEDTIANSNYNSLQVQVEKRFGHGVEFHAAYTWSKSFDEASSFENVLEPRRFSPELRAVAVRRDAIGSFIATTGSFRFRNDTASPAN